MSAAPNDALLHNNLGNLRLRLGDAKGAEAAYRNAVAHRPDYADAHYNLGIVLKAAGRSAEAADAFRQALQHRPQYPEAMVQLGTLLSESGSKEQSLALYDSALAINRAYFDAHYYRGIALTALERMDDAIASLRSALSVNPNSAEAHYALGNCYERSQRESEALEEFDKAVELAPALVEAHSRLNALAWQMGRSDLTHQSYARARARIGDTPDLLLAEADQRLRQNELEHSERLLRRAREIAPQRNDISNVLARALVMQHKFDEGIALLEDAARLEPKIVHHHRGLANALLQAGRAKEAIAIVEQGLALAPHDQLLLAFELLAFRETGDSRLARLGDQEKLVGVYELAPPPGYADIATFNRALAEELAALHTRNVEPLDQTLRNGTQTPGHLFERPGRAVEAIRERIREAVGDYVGRLPNDPGHPLFGRKREAFDFSGSWSCRLRSSGYHSNHVHPQGWISSAYYVALPEEIEDAQARQGWLKFGESNLALGERDRPERVEKPAVGKLVLFPSYFWHGTVPFASDDVRLTIAFDVVPGSAKNMPRSSGY
ncbi:MAG: tetratricopeptide repeat protein [Alphaproteobacteria bacterium]|nr:tetratricopeptide repeat protein [Alphaproteobacteria bacterium]